MQSYQENVTELYANGHAENTADREADSNLGTVHQDAIVQPVMTIALQEQNTNHVFGLDMDDYPEFTPVHTGPTLTIAETGEYPQATEAYYLDTYGIDLSAWDNYNPLMCDFSSPIATIITDHHYYLTHTHNCVDFTTILSLKYGNDVPLPGPSFQPHNHIKGIDMFLKSSFLFHYSLSPSERKIYPDFFSYHFINEEGESPFASFDMETLIDSPNNFLVFSAGDHIVTVHSIHDMLQFEAGNLKQVMTEYPLNLFLLTQFSVYLYLVESRDILNAYMYSSVTNNELLMCFSMLHKCFTHPAIKEINATYPFTRLQPYYRLPQRNEAQSLLFLLMFGDRLGHYEFYHYDPEISFDEVLYRAHVNAVIQHDIVMSNYSLTPTKLPYLEELHNLYGYCSTNTPRAGIDSIPAIFTPDHFTDIGSPAITPSCCGTFKLFLATRTKVEYHKTLLIKALEAANIRFQPIVSHFIMNCEALFLFLEELKGCSNMRSLYFAFHKLHNAVSLSSRVRLVYKEIVRYLLEIPVMMGKASFSDMANPFTTLRDWLEDPTTVPDAIGRHFFVFVSYLCGCMITKEKMPALAHYGRMVTRNMPEAYKVNEVKFLGAILFILEGGWQLVIHKDITWVHSKNSYSQLAKRIVQAGKDVLLLQDMRDHTHPTYTSVCLFEDELRDIEKKMDEIYIIQGGKDTGTLNNTNGLHQYRVLELRVSKILKQVKKFKLNKYMRAQPFTTYFYGKAGVGKSICRDITMHLAQCTFKRARRPAYNVSLDDIRPDGYDGEEDVSGDDIDQISTEFGGDAIMRLYQRLDNTNPFHPDMSDLPKKGQVSMEPKNIWFTSNNCPPVNSNVYPHREALYRRMQYVMEVKLRDGKKDLEYNAVKPFKYSAKDIAETYSVTLRHWNSEKHKVHNMSTLDTWEPVPGFVDVTLQEAQAGLMAIMRVHFARQESALRVSEQMANDVSCPHDTMVGICQICSDNLVCDDGTCGECTICAGGHNDKVMELTIKALDRDMPEMDIVEEIKKYGKKTGLQPKSAASVTAATLLTIMLYNSAKFHLAISRTPLFYKNKTMHDKVIQGVLNRWSVARIFTRKKDRHLEFDPQIYDDDIELEFQDIRHPLGFVDRVNLYKLVHVISIVATVYFTYTVVTKASTAITSKLTRKKPPEATPRANFHSWEQDSEDIFTTLQKTTNITNLEFLIRRASVAFLSTNMKGAVVNNNALHIYQGYYVTVAHGMFESASIDHDNTLWPVEYISNIADDLILVKSELVLESTLHYFASHTRQFSCAPHHVYLQKCVKTLAHMHSIKHNATIHTSLVSSVESWASYPGSRTILAHDLLTQPTAVYVGPFASDNGTCGSAAVRLGRGENFGHIDSILVAGSDDMTIMMPLDVSTLVAAIASDGKVKPKAALSLPMWDMPCCNTSMGPLAKKATISYHTPPKGTIIWGTLHRNGRPVHSHKSNKPKVFESLFHPYLRDVSPIVDTYTVPNLGRVVVDGETVSSPWDFNVELLFSPKDSFPREDFEDAAAEFLSGFEEVEFRGPLTIDEAFHGACGEKRINFATSYGFPFNTPKKNVLECIDAHNNLYRFDDVGKDMHTAMLEVYKMGGRVYPPFTSALKASEVVSVKKNEMGKIRMFQGPPMPFIVVVRQYFLPVLSFLKNHPQAENAIGINTFGPEWEKLYERLMQFGPGRVIAGDYAAFDKTISELAIRMAFKILIALAKKTGNYTPEDITIMESIAEDSALPTMILKGDVFTMPGSLSSGHPLTTLINCIVGSLYLRIAFKHTAVYGASRLPVPLALFRKFVKPTTFGDDNTMSVSTEIDFSHTMIQDFFAKYNVTYTMAEKDAETRPYITVEESSFLSRGFLVFNGYVLDPLSLKSIVKCLAFRKESILSEQERLLDILKDQHRELLRQPEDVRKIYLKWFDDLLGIYNQHFNTTLKFLEGGYPQKQTIEEVMEGKTVTSEVLVTFRSVL